MHVADLASANPVEVVSTDRHTVKPWFQGRIPFTFDVPDLQGSPFTLTGGRVTYFHQEPGAHLVFAYQRHFISAFIFRDTPQLAITGASFTDHSTSFNLQTWTQDGLRYVLVSDVNPDTLKQLANLLQHARSGASGRPANRRPQSKSLKFGQIYCKYDGTLVYTPAVPFSRRHSL